MDKAIFFTSEPALKSRVTFLFDVVIAPWLIKIVKFDCMLLVEGISGVLNVLSGITFPVLPLRMKVAVNVVSEVMLVSVLDWKVRVSDQLTKRYPWSGTAVTVEPSEP